MGNINSIPVAMEDNSRALTLLGGLAISIVGFQICRKVLPWIYVNIVAPKLCGCSVNLATIGEWAGESPLWFELCADRAGLSGRLCHAFPQSRQIRMSRTPRHIVIHAYYSYYIRTKHISNVSNLCSYHRLDRWHWKGLRQGGTYKKNTYDKELDLLDKGDNLHDSWYNHY